MYRFLLSAILCLGLCAPAFGTQNKTINGSTANSSGGWGSLAGTLATAANSGSGGANNFNYVSNGGGLDWTYRAFSASDPAPSAITSNGYLESTDGAQCYVQLEAASSACPNAGDHYWLSFWMRGQRTAGALVGSDLASNLCGVFTGGTSLLSNLTLNNSTAATAPGYNFSYSGTLVGTPTILWDSNASTKSPMMKFGEWYHFTVHLYRHASAGYGELFINDRKVCQTAATDTSTTITWTGQNVYILTPAWSGVQWHLAGPVESWVGTDITLNPLHSLDAGRPVNKVFMPAHANTGGLAQGIDWQWTGAGLAVHTEHANVAGSARRKIFKCTSGTPVATTTQSIGDLPYNEQGWATLVWPDIYLPGGYLTLAINNAGNSAQLWSFQFSNSTTNSAYWISAGSDFMQMFTGTPAASRYVFMQHLNRDGRARWTMIDLTTALSGNGKGAYSGPLPDWTPQTLGKCSMTFTFNTTASEVSGLVVASRPSLVCVDSISSGLDSTITPNMRNPYTVAQGLPTLEERQCIPNGYWNQRESGMPRSLIVGTCGQSGLTRRDWSLNVLAGLEYTSGCEFIAIDGGCVNDVLATTVALTTSYTHAANSTKRSITETIEKLTKGDNKVWMTTVFQRNREAPVTAITDNGSGKCRITCGATAGSAHGIPSDTYYPRITGGTGIAGIDNANYLDIITSSIATNTFDVDVAYSAPTLVSPIVVTMSANQEAMRTAINTHIRSEVRRLQYKGLVSLSDIDADQTANVATYPKTLGTGATWSDAVHPQVWSPAGAYTAGSWIVAQRMALTRFVPPNPKGQRRWPLLLNGRN